MVWKIAFAVLIMYVIIGLTITEFRESWVVTSSDRARRFVNAISRMFRLPEMIFDAIERVATRLT